MTRAGNFHASDNTKIVLILGALFLGISMLDFGGNFAKLDGSSQSYVWDGNYGTTYKRPAVATKNRAISYWAQDISEGYSVPRINDAPASLVEAEQSSGCGLPKPSAGAQVVFVEIYGGYDRAALHFATKRRVERERRRKKNQTNRPGPWRQCRKTGRCFRDRR